ncbi:hypothetical protein N7G274_004694 [Stereocaulon virgatum]|uniref:Uncharacterized protein n=1 Tax=Stereocaulon virgatum TaxID=373712 RepID=A0ABR4A9V9_9LECA
MPQPGEQHKPAATSVNPYEEVKPCIREYTAFEIATLSSRLEKQLGPEYISSRPGAGGGKVHYLSADKCINLANEVFGFNGWSSGIQQVQIDFVDENQSSGKVSLGLSVIVRVTLRDGTYHEDIGYGHIENCKGKAPAFEKAKKEGTTDGLKRALRNFGNVLGNCVYDKEYVAKVTKLKIAPTKWDPGNLHRHPDFAPIKKELIDEDLSKQPSLPQMRGGWPAETDESRVPTSIDPEDEFGSDDFDEVDFSVPQGDHPDEVALDPSLNSEQLRRRNSPANSGRPQIRNADQNYYQRVRAPLARHQSTGTALSPQTPINAGVNSMARPMTMSEGLKPRGQSAKPQQPAQMQQENMHMKPHQLPPPRLPQDPQLAIDTHPNDAPSLDSSNTSEHEPPVGFFTARAAESLQSGPVSAMNAPAFDPHLESPSIRKTAGVDHSKTKPVGRDVVRAPPAPGVPRTSFTNAQSDKMRKVGMPMVAASPLQNRGSYKPPHMKRPAESIGARSALGDVTNESVNVSADAAGDVKRQKVGMEAPGVSNNHGMLNI